MSKNKTNGTRQVCGRLVDSVIDPILFSINRAQDLTDEEKRKFSKLVVKSGHEAIRNFIYGIEDESVGVKISYNGTVLNDQSFKMQSTQLREAAASLRECLPRWRKNALACQNDQYIVLK